MELYFLDDSFNVLAGPLDELTSVVWKVRYFETGTFTLHFPRNLLSKVNGAVYVRTGDNDGPIRCGRIEYLETSDDGGCEIGGHLLEILLADRVISGKRTYQGSLTDAVLAAVRENLNNQIITIGDCALISDNVTVSSEWDNLADWLYSILKPHGASFTVTLDPDTLLPVFRLVKGLDRSTDFCEAEPAIFSYSFGNIGSISLTK